MVNAKQVPNTGSIVLKETVKQALGSEDKSVEGQMAVAALSVLEGKLAKLVKPVIEVVDRMAKVHGAFQSAMFAIIREATHKAEGQAFFQYVEAKVAEHFATRDDEGKLLEVPKIREIAGLSSWETVKSQLLQGFEIQARLGSKTEKIGKLDPKDGRYAGKDGARTWLNDIRDAQVKAQADYQAKLEAESNAKVAEANRGKDSGKDTSGSVSVDGNNDRIEFELPEMIRAGMTVLQRVVIESSKIKTNNPDFYRLVGQELRGAADRIGQHIQAYHDSVRSNAANAGKMTREQASERLQMRRQLQDAAPDADAEDQLTADALAEMA